MHRLIFHSLDDRTRYHNTDQQHHPLSLFPIWWLTPPKDIIYSKRKAKRVNHFGVSKIGVKVRSCDGPDGIHFLTDWCCLFVLQRCFFFGVRYGVWCGLVRSRKTKHPRKDDPIWTRKTISILTAVTIRRTGKANRYEESIDSGKM